MIDKTSRCVYADRESLGIVFIILGYLKYVLSGTISSPTSIIASFGIIKLLNSISSFPMFQSPINAIIIFRY